MTSGTGSCPQCACCASQLADGGQPSRVALRLISDGTMAQGCGVCENCDQWGCCGFRIDRGTLTTSSNLGGSTMTGFPTVARSRLRSWSIAALVIGTLLGGTALAV